ncbi:abc transporter [Moniliophthora roreri]|nr:abc transporter [Moniliophthora roreri]
MSPRFKQEKNNRTSPHESYSDNDIPLSNSIKPSSQREASVGSLLSFERLSYTVTDKKGDKRVLVDDVSLQVKSGELFAIMGPSGAGKSTLLDLMAFRKPLMTGSSVHLNGRPMTSQSMYKISAFVEQEDVLLGVLTVRETVSYTLRLHSPLLSRKQVNVRVDQVLTALGLQSCMDQRIGTPISRGISGGQKRRVTAACAMVTFPRILYLDEVTSGLDSTSAREVMAAIRNLAVAEGIIVIATIHQPSVETLGQFDKLLLLSRGKVCYSGSVGGLESFFEGWGRPIGRFSTPAEHAMNFLNEDFSGGTTSTAEEFRQHYLSTLSTWQDSGPSSHSYTSTWLAPQENGREVDEAGPAGTLLWNTLTLCERSTINYARNLLAYGVRAGMYAGMGLMLATIWINLGENDSTINDRLSVHFYSAAFLSFLFLIYQLRPLIELPVILNIANRIAVSISLSDTLLQMSVAGIPSFLEERSVFFREKKNGLYSTLPFVLANTLVNIPFLFLCTLLFCVICYWAIGLHPGAAAFFRYLAFLYLTIFAAETQCLLIAALIPIFVAALAISAFMNGFWMSVGGYFIKARSLPKFWFYSFHYMDYQRYAFELLSNSDLRGLIFRCTDACQCAYPSSLPADACAVSGDDVLHYLDIRNVGYGKWVAVVLGINLIYRIMLYVALRLRTE